MRKRKLTLIDNARAVLMQAWSVRFAVLSAFFAIAGAALPELRDLMPAHTFSILSAVCAGGTVLARIIRQPETLP